MVCPGVETGASFVPTMLAHLDCRAMVLGSYGFGALADPGSAMASAVHGLLILFVAVFGLRLMLGEPVAGRDVAGGIVKIGIVLTLATSWPAWRATGYQLVFEGPAEIAGSVGLASGVPTDDLARRLQQVDAGIVTLTTLGSGIVETSVLPADGIDMKTGIALKDASALGWGRIAFLAATLGPIGLLRLSAGILLALAPLFAGFLLFAAARDLFFGWLRALGFCALGGLAIMICISVELSLLASWLRNVIALRSGGAAALSSPTELLAMACAFCVMNFGILALAARLLFFSRSGLVRLATRMAGSWTSTHERTPTPSGVIAGPPQAELGRAQRLAEAVSQSARREELGRARAMRDPASVGHDAPRGSRGSAGREPQTLGNSYRRTYHRTSLAKDRRDARS